MSALNLLNRFYFRIVLVLFMSCSPFAYANVQLQVDGNGILTGATGVEISNAIYNVEFKGGSCISLFNGCAVNEDFVFHDINSAYAASSALLEQVITGVYDTNYTLTRGCGYQRLFVDCGIITPYAPYFETYNGATVHGFYMVYADNNNSIYSDSYQDGIFSATYNMGNVYTFAVWSVAVSAVPEPSSVILLCLGLAGISFVSARKRRITHR